MKNVMIVDDNCLTAEGMPYKGLLPALESKDSSNVSPAATSFTY